MEKSPSLELTVPWLVKKFHHRWNTMFHYSDYRSPALTLTWARSSHSIYYYNICLDTASGLFLQASPTKRCAHLSSLPIRTTSPSHLIPLDLIARLTFIEECISWSFSISSLLQSPFTSSLLGQNIPLFLRIVLSNFSANIPTSFSEVKCHTYKRTGNIVDLYILVFMFLSNKWED